MKVEKKSLTNNIFYNVLYNILNILFPLITIPYLSRILSADGLGKINFARNIVAWFCLFASLGIPRYGVREVAKAKNSDKILNKVTIELIIINSISTICCTCVFVLMIFKNTYFNNNKLLYLVTGIQLFLNIFNVDWFYQGVEDFKFITQRSFFIKIISFISMFIFVKDKEDYIIYAFLQSLAVVGNNVLNCYNLKNYLKISKNKLQFRIHIKPIITLFSTQLAVSVYSLLDTTMLGIIGNDEMVGYYTNCHKVINVIAVFTASVNSVLLPRFVKYLSEGNEEELKKLAEKILNFIIWICIPIVIGSIMTSKQVVILYFGKDFESCIVTLQLFTPFILFTTIGNLFGTQLLMALQQEKKLMYTVVVGAIINFLLNLCLIPKLFQNGAVIASVITEAIVMILQIRYVSSFIRLKLSKNVMFSICISNILMIIYILVINKIINSLIISLVLDVLGSIVIHIIINIFLKNELFFEMKNIFLEKILKTRNILD